MFLAATGLAAAGFWSWPRLVSTTAEAEIEQLLGRKFDEHQLGCFELSRNSLNLCEVRLRRGTLEARLEDVRLSFDVELGGASDVTVSLTHASTSGGDLRGDVQGVLRDALRGSDGSSPSPASGRLEARLDGLGVAADALDVQVSAGDELRVEGTLVVGGNWTELRADLLDARLDFGKLQVAASSASSTFYADDPDDRRIRLREVQVRTEFVTTPPASGTAVVEDGLARLELESSGGSWELSGELRGTADAPRASAVVQLRGLRLDETTSAAPSWLRAGAVTGQVQVSATEAQVSADVEVALEGAVVSHPTLSSQDVLLEGVLEASGRYELEGRNLVLEKALATPLSDRSEVRVSASGRGQLAADGSLKSLAGRLELAKAPCQDLLDHIPRGLAPGLEDFKMSGDVSGFFELDADVDELENLELRGRLEADGCRVLRMPAEVRNLRGPFGHVVRMRDGRTIHRVLGAGGGDFAPLDLVASSLPAAVTATEDGRFWRHDGFSRGQLEAALRRNLASGAMRRGGSTITMQMVKNVLLGHEKTVSRKVQEAYLTWIVERLLSKRRIMEIYLNVVEFGPGIYGVVHAADYYFGKHPGELSSLESVFLASLLPRPVERHEMWCRGELTSRHESYLRRVHARMLEKGLISSDEHRRAEASGVRFDRRGWPGEARCLERGRRVTEGPHTQEAVTGLLAR